MELREEIQRLKESATTQAEAQAALKERLKEELNSCDLALNNHSTFQLEMMRMRSCAFISNFVPIAVVIE
jgi:hypothetical protein